MMRTKLVFTLVAFLTACSVFGQCIPSDTPIECWHRFVPEIKDQAAAASEQVVAAANTGLTSLVSPASSALQDFLSILSAGLESSSLSSNGAALTFDWNPRIGKDQPIKIEAVFAEPKLNAAVTEALSNNAAALTTLNDSLTNTDDLITSVTYSPVNANFGRSIEPHRIYFNSLIATAFTAAVAQADDAMFKALLDVGVDTNSFSKRINVILADKPAEQKALLNKIQTAARELEKTQVFADTLTRSFAKLLNNQPQLYASLQYHERKNIVGPSETILKVTYEHGFLNLNTFMKKYRALCDPLIVLQSDDARKTNCVGLLEAYAGGAGPDESGDGGRVAFSVEYHDSRPIHVDLSEYSVKYDIDAGRMVVVSLAGGWIIAPRANQKSGRIDLSLSYEDIRNAAVIPGTTGTPADVKSRLIAAITYTQKISDTISFPVSLNYANHAAYLSNIDRKLNAHFGLQYKLPMK